MKFYSRVNERILELKGKADRAKSILLNPYDMNVILLESSKKDMEIGNFLVKKSIEEIESIVEKNEDLRDYKMKIEFEKDKEQIINQQHQIEKEIESITNKNINEQVINFMIEEKNKQQDLYEKYFSLNSDIESILKTHKEKLPECENKKKIKSDKLKKLNRENLKLIEKIQKLENDRKKQKLDGKSSIDKTNSEFIEEKFLSDTRIEDQNTINEISKIGTSKLISNYEKENRSINITDLLNDNENLKENFQNLKKLKNRLNLSKKEHRFISNEIAKLNTKYFYLSKLFTEGNHEISKELFKIHEIQLDKVVTSKSADTNSHLYLRLYKDKSLRNSKVPYTSEEELKLPKIYDNIKKKYNFPVVEKSEPSSLIYKAINQMVEENNLQDLKKKMSFQDKKIEWEEFKNLSAYQIQTMLTLNKDLIKLLESKIYPIRNINSSD